MAIARARAHAPHADHDFSVNLARAQEGSPRACQWLYESLAGRVAGYLRLHGAGEPDDMTNEVFIRVFDHLARFEGGESDFRSWVFTIAHRMLIDEHRRESRRPQTLDLAPALVEELRGGNAEHDALAQLERDHVVEVLEELNPDQRAVLMLRIIGDLTTEQVAATLGKSRGAVKALQRRGIAALGRRISEESS